MANISDYTYFIRDIHIPLDENQAEITSYIDKYEEKILIICFGFDMYDEFKTAIAGTPDQKWLDLRDGKKYEVDGITVNWPGLINLQKESLIAYYVYYQYVVHSPNYYANGLRNSLAENSKMIDPKFKQVEAYNKCIELIGNSSDYFTKGTLYNYLTQHSSDFPNWDFSTLGKINVFNI